MYTQPAHLVTIGIAHCAAPMNGQMISIDILK
jgi:hypothetical protein